MLCAGHAPAKRNTVSSTPDVSFSRDTSQLDTGTRNSRNTNYTLERHRLLEEDSDIFPVERCQKNMDTFKTVGHVDTSVKQINISIAPEMIHQNETLLPKPALLTQNIGHRHTI